jgi:hypothetical protein
VTAGVLLLANRCVPLALTLLAPIIVNISAFHIFLRPSPIRVGFLLVTEIYLAWSYRDAFRGVLAARARPIAAIRDGATTAEPAAAHREVTNEAVLSRG